MGAVARRGAFHVAFFLSGAAGLVWQVAWVRQLGLAFGGTVPSVTLVTTVFLAGLGVGAHFGGKVADRNRQPARLYAACEAAIAAWGLALLPVLQLLATSGLGGWQTNTEGWQVPSPGTRLLQLGATALTLGLPSVLMGASLPLLGRPALGGHPRSAGWRAAVLVGVNTLGAALGALATDLWAVPAFGLRATQGGAAALGFSAAVIVAFASAGAADLEAPARAAPGSADDAPPTSATPSAAPPRLGLALGLAGFAAMGLEVAWFRFFSSALGPYRAVYASLLAVILVSWFAGGLLAGRATRRVPPFVVFAAAQMAVATLTVAGLFTFDSRALLVRQLQLAAFDSSALVLKAHVVNLVTLAWGVAPAALAMGAAFPVANALASPDAARVGRTIGGLWLATTTGNALGSLVTGLVLLPWLGLQLTVLLLVALAGLAPLVLRPRVLLWVGVLPAAVGLLVSSDHLVLAAFPYGRLDAEGVLDIREGVNETIVVTGRRGGPARLWTNGHPMSSTTEGAQRYMRLMAHVPLLALPEPRRALVICFGVGNTAHAASLHPLVHLDIADLSPDVLAEAPWFAYANHDVLEDPRTHVFVDDGRHVLRSFPPQTWDLVTLEPPPIAHAGVASLYSVEFYQTVRERLRDEGWISQWLPAYQVPAPTVLSLVRAFVDVFPNAVLLVGDGKELLLLGSRSTAPLTLDAGLVSQNLRSRPTVAADLDRLGVTDLRDLAALFASDADTLRAATAHTAPMTDDWPIAESSQVSHATRTTFPAELLAPERWAAFVPSLAGDPEVAAAAAERAAAWHDGGFAQYSTFPAGE